MLLTHSSLTKNIVFSVLIVTLPCLGSISQTMNKSRKNDQRKFVLDSNYLKRNIFPEYQCKENDIQIIDQISLGSKKINLFWSEKTFKKNCQILKKNPNTRFKHTLNKDFIHPQRLYNIIPEETNILQKIKLFVTKLWAKKPETLYTTSKIKSGRGQGFKHQILPMFTIPLHKIIKSKHIAFSIKVPFIKRLLQHKVDVNMHNVKVLQIHYHDGLNNYIDRQCSVWSYMPICSLFKADKKENNAYLATIDLLLKNSTTVFKEKSNNINIDGISYDLYESLSCFPDHLYFFDFLKEIITRSNEDIHRYYYENEEKLIFQKKQEIMLYFMEKLSAKQKKQLPLIMMTSYDELTKEWDIHYLNSFKEGIVKKNLQITLDFIVNNGRKNNGLNFVAFEKIIQKAKFYNFLLCCEEKFSGKNSHLKIPKPVLKIIFSHTKRDNIIFSHPERDLYTFIYSEEQKTVRNYFYNEISTWH